MKHVSILVLLALCISGCGSGPQGSPGAAGATGANGATGAAGPQGPAGPAASPSPSPSESAIQLMVDAQNAERLAVGQEPYTPGLVCNLYTVPGTTTGILAATNGGVAPVLTLVGTSWEYLGVFNQPNASVTAGLNVLPTALQPDYQTYYILKCTGTLVVADDTWHNFSLSSDDGANLYINGGNPLINNDGSHGIQTASAAKFLGYGFYTFELDYFQGAGNEALILQEDGAVMSAAGFYH